MKQCLLKTNCLHLFLLHLSFSDKPFVYSGLSLLKLKYKSYKC